jgi:hypothetical protein
MLGKGTPTRSTRAALPENIRCAALFCLMAQFQIFLSVN